MRYVNILLALGFLWSTSASAYVACNNVDVKVQTATGTGFHNLNETGVTGSMIFLSVPAANCWNSTGESMASRIYVVIDEMGNPTGLKKLWSSMLLSAEAQNKTISFHASDRGRNSSGTQVLTPYYLTVNK